MSKSKNYRTTPHCNGWAVKRDGRSRADSIHGTQSAAWNEARRLARGAGGEAVLHGTKGEICTRNTYDPDPYPEG